MSSRTQLPSALSVKPVQSVDTMKIETSILDPVTINKNSCRFVLERKGILDVGSCVQLGVVCSSDPNREAFFPIRTGINSLIRSATLRIGTKAIATTDEFGHYSTLWRSMKTLEERNRKDYFAKGTLDGLEPANDTANGSFQPKMVNWDENETEGEVGEQIKPTDDEDTTPLFSVKLSELFPHLMKGLQLPLYLINEPISIELQFNTQTHTNNGSDDSNGPICMQAEGKTEQYNVQVSEKNVKFLADYLTYSDSRMEETARLTMSDAGLIVPYDDVILTTYSIPAVNDPGADVKTPQSVNRELGFCGKKVKHIVWADAPVKGDIAELNGLRGEYCSRACEKPDTYNIRVNDLNVYNREVERETYKQSQLALVTGVDINVGVAEYSYNTIVDEDYKQTNQMIGKNTIKLENYTTDQLQAQSHYCGVSLVTDPITGEGTDIGQKPILIERTLYRTTDNYTARTNYTWAAYERTMVLRHGNVSVTN